MMNYEVHVVQSFVDFTSIAFVSLWKWYLHDDDNNHNKNDNLKFEQQADMSVYIEIEQILCAVNFQSFVLLLRVFLYFQLIAGDDIPRWVCHKKA